MTLLLEIALRVSAPALAGLVACALLRRHSAALRHAVLAAAVTAAAAVIPLALVMPSWGAVLPVASVVALPAPSSMPASVADVRAVTSAAPPPFTAPDAARLIFFAWLAGAALGTGLLLLGVVRLARLRLRAEPVVDGHWRRLVGEIAADYGIRRPIVLLASGSSDVLATWGLFRPRVLLPAYALAWDEARTHAVLCHELAHIKRCDWTVQLAAEMLRAFLWFNPLLWMLCARVRREGEHACDDTVLDRGVPAAAYASHLVEIAKASRRPTRGWVPAMSIARPSTLEERVTAMLNNTLDRQAPSRRAMAVLVAALIGIALPVASFDVFAQDAGPRTLSGRVYDTSGLVLPAVEVTLVNEQQVRWSTVTDGSGTFEFTPVGGAKYVLEAALPGFRPLRNEFSLKAAKDWNRNITMQVGELEETIMVKAKRPTQAPRAAATGAGGPVRVGGNIKVPRKIKDARPVYPAAMRDAGLEGVVPMEALIGMDGTVTFVRVMSAQVHPEFARAAEDAVRQWAFSPTLLNGVPVDVQMTVSVQFSLED